MDKQKLIEDAAETSNLAVSKLLGVDPDSPLVDEALQSAMGLHRMRLFKLSQFFCAEMERCIAANAYFAACAMATSAVEAVLTLLCF